MNIVVGSQNEVKVSAVALALQRYPLFSHATLRSFAASSGVSEQPFSLDETIRGAMQRARMAFQQGDLGFGIEDGLMRVPHTKTGYMNVCVCAIYDGKTYHLGLSSAFEYPPSIMRAVLDKSMDISQAAYQLGLTADKQSGKADGVIGMLTKGRLIRRDYTIQAVEMALIHLEQADLFTLEDASTP